MMNRVKGVMASSLVAMTAMGSMAMAEHPGKAIYNGEGVSPSCMSCHDAGVLGAPALGNAEDWQDRGRDAQALSQTTWEGKSPMPAYKDLGATREQVLQAVQYMLSQLPPASDQAEPSGESATTEATRADMAHLDAVRHGDQLYRLGMSFEAQNPAYED